MCFLLRSVQAASKKTYLSSKSEPSVAQNYLDYVILDPHQSSSLRMQALPLDPYTYLQVHLLLWVCVCLCIYVYCVKGRLCANFSINSMIEIHLTSGIFIIFRSIIYPLFSHAAKILIETH